MDERAVRTRAMDEGNARTTGYCRFLREGSAVSGKRWSDRHSSIRPVLRTSCARQVQSRLCCPRASVASFLPRLAACALHSRNERFWRVTRHSAEETSCPRSAIDGELQYIWTGDPASPRHEELAMPEIAVQPLLNTPSIAIRDVICRGTCKHQSAAESAAAMHLVFPYRGVYVRHLGRDDAVAEANQVLFFNPGDGYRVSHPVAGGDASVDLVITESVLRELVPRALLRDGPMLAFRLQRLRIDPRAQALVALLRHSLSLNTAETLEAESLALTLVR